jgi:hypothetical protein
MPQRPLRALLPVSLLVLGMILAGLGPVWETAQRAPEGTARAYLVAVEQGDLDAALATIAPEFREAARERVLAQLGNRYRIETLVLGRPSSGDRLLGRPSSGDRLLGRPLPVAWVTLLAEVTTVTGERWRSTSTTPLVERHGNWYLTMPLFA